MTHYQFGDLGNIYFKTNIRLLLYNLIQLNRWMPYEGRLCIQCFVIPITASQVYLIVGFEICSNNNWQHDDVMTWICEGLFMRGKFTGSVMQNL